MQKKIKTCPECGDNFEVKTRPPKYCKPCTKEKRKEWVRGYTGARGRYISKDPLPEIDWAMEKQFAFFYDCVGVRYTNIKEVNAVVNQGSHFNKRRSLLR
jgi:hypothetical protein